MSLDSMEKSPVDQWEYEGLQVDTRAKDSPEKHLIRGAQVLRNREESDNEANFLNEKQVAVIEEQQASSHSLGSPTVLNRETSSIKMVDEVAGIPPEPKVRKIGGVRRRDFWIVFGIVLAMAIAAAIIGGAIGATRHSSTSTLSDPKISNTPSHNTESNPPVQLSNVIIGSPISVVSYTTGDPQGQQTFRLYYQTTRGNVNEAVSNDLSLWQNVPIFTDAENNTGLAAVTYSKNSIQHGSIFYIAGGRLQEKRRTFNTLGVWEQAGLSTNVWPIPSSNGSSDDNGLKNGWDRYRMAAVYSENFHSGPGVRLFYHAEQITSQSNETYTHCVQELIWDRLKDKWTQGVNFTKAVPRSHLSATIDESTGILRLFYSSGGGELQEQMLNITDPNPRYIESTAVSHNGTTYLYHYQNDTAPTIREITITGSQSSNSQEGFNLTNSLVASPQLQSPEGIAPYQPLAAAITNIKGLEPRIYVFWADGPAGPLTPSTLGPDTSSGYVNLAAVRKTVQSNTWPMYPDSRMAIPLGGNGSQPNLG